MDQRLHPPPPPPPAQHQQQHYLAPPVHGLSSLAAAVEHGAGSSATAGGGAGAGAGSSRGDDSPSPSRFSVSRSRSRSPGRLPASHHQISAKRKEQHRIEYARHMRQFWAKQKELIERTDYKRLKHDLPLARIKKIMKSDDEVRMISAEVPILFSKACELFILDLTMRAWAHTADTNRRTLQRSDVADAILEGEGMDFLVDIVPRDEETAAAAVPAAGAVVTETGEPASGGVVASSSVGMDTEKLLRLLDQEMNGDKRAQGMRDGAAAAASAAGSPASSGNGKIEAAKRREEEEKAGSK